MPSSAKKLAGQDSRDEFIREAFTITSYGAELILFHIDQTQAITG